MLLDLLSPDNYALYNVKLAQMLGLHNSIYISVLLNIYNKATNKNKLYDGGYFKVDREYIKSKTTFTKEEQRELDYELSQLKILTVKDRDFILVDTALLTTYVKHEDEPDIKNVISSVKKKKTKTDIIKDKLKSKVITTNGELRDAYASWIDAVMSKDGWMSETTVVDGQSKIDKFSNRNLDVALEILKIATINGYRDIDWAINKYNVANKNKPVDTIHLNNEETIIKRGKKPVKLSDEVF